MANRAEEEWSVNNPRVYFARCTFLHTIGNLYVCSFFRVDFAKKKLPATLCSNSIFCYSSVPYQQTKCVELFKNIHFLPLPVETQLVICFYELCA